MIGEVVFWLTFAVLVVVVVVGYSINIWLDWRRDK